MTESAAPVPPQHPAEITIFQAPGMLVTSQRLAVAGRTWPLGDVERVEAIRRSPRVMPLLMLLGLGVVLGLPALLAAMAASGSQGRGFYEVALVMAVLAIFGSIGSLLSAGDTSCLVLRTRHRERRVFRSRDHEFVSSLAAVVAGAVTAARQGSELAPHSTPWLSRSGPRATQPACPQPTGGEVPAVTRRFGPPEG